MSDPTITRKRKGMCKNPDCDLCMSRTVQEIEPGEEFVCSECSCPLEEVKDVKKATKKAFSPAIVAGVASLAIAIALCVWWFGFRDGEAKAEDGGDGQEQVDKGGKTDPTSGEDSASNDTIVAPLPEPEPAPESEPGQEPKVNNPKPVSGDATLSLGCGTYSGPVNNGKPDGMGGTFTFRSAYTLDLKDGMGTTVALSPGDKIVSTKFVNGKFVQGEIHFADQSRKYVTGVNATL